MTPTPKKQTEKITKRGGCIVRVITMLVLHLQRVLGRVGLACENFALYRARCQIAPLKRRMESWAFWRWTLQTQIDKSVVDRPLQTRELPGLYGKKVLVWWQRGNGGVGPLYPMFDPPFNELNSETALAAWRRYARFPPEPSTALCDAPPMTVMENF